MANLMNEKAEIIFSKFIRLRTYQRKGLNQIQPIGERASSIILEVFERVLAMVTYLNQRFDVSMCILFAKVID